MTDGTRDLLSGFGRCPFGFYPGIIFEIYHLSPCHVHPLFSRSVVRPDFAPDPDSNQCPITKLNEESYPCTIFLLKKRTMKDNSAIWIVSPRKFALVPRCFKACVSMSEVQSVGRATTSVAKKNAICVVSPS